MESLTPLIKTIHARELFINLVEDAYKNNSLSTAGISDDFQLALKSLAITSAADINEDTLALLKTDLLSAPVSRLEISIVLSGSALDAIYATIFGGKPGLLEIVMNYSVFGGFILYHEGKVYDNSLGTLLHDLFISESLKVKLAQLL